MTMEEQAGPPLHIGKSGLYAPRIGFGCMGLSGSYGSIERTDALATILTAIDAGITLLDTADVYGNGENERILGDALKKRDRTKLIIATKGGATRDDQGRATNCGRPEYLIDACEKSLKRLGTDYIDLYYLHRVDPAVPIEDSIGALGRLVTDGKIRAIGLSEVSEATLRKAHATHPVAALESEFSLAYRAQADSLFGACRELGISFIAYSPLGRGLLTDASLSDRKFEKGDIRSAIPRFNSDNIQHNLKALREMQTLAGNMGITIAQLALAWILNSTSETFVIPGARATQHVLMNVSAARIHMPQSTIESLNAMFSGAAIIGERHNARMLSRVGL